MKRSGFLKRLGLGILAAPMLIQAAFAQKKVSTFNPCTIFFDCSSEGFKVTNITCKGHDSAELLRIYRETGNIPLDGNKLQHIWPASYDSKIG